jgi:hypothetical protein
VLGVPESGLPVRAVADGSVGVPTLSQVTSLAATDELTDRSRDQELPHRPRLRRDPRLRRCGGRRGGPQRNRRRPDHLPVVHDREPRRGQVAAAGRRSSLLALQSGIDAAIPLAVARGYEWVSPQWPVDSAYGAAAHAGGRRVVPFTIDSAPAMAMAAATGADALITNDPTRARLTVAAGFPRADAPVGSAASSKVRVRGGEAAVKVRCNSIRRRTCVGNLVLNVGHRVVGSAEYELTGGRTRAVRVGVRSGAKGKGSATVSTYDERGRPGRARTSITLS